MNVSRKSLINGLSYALDILGKNNVSHSKSVAYLSVLLCRELKIEEKTVQNIYYAALLHDIGISEEFFKGKVYLDGMKRHCSIGSKIVRKLPLEREISDYILYHHEYSDGSGAFGLLEQDIPLGGLIIGFASAFDDVFAQTEKFNLSVLSKIDNWVANIKPRFSKEIVDAFNRIIKKALLLLDYFSVETRYNLGRQIGIEDDVCYNTEDVTKFAYCFAELNDQRSQFTFHHSTEIAELAKKVSAHLGYDEATQSKVFIAGLLHDVGKLDISTDILHKNGPLNPDERFEMNRHAYFTRKVLEQIDGFDDIVNMAANHHEKIDGTGYSMGITGDDLSELEKLMAICDIFQALTEERPYRANMRLEKVQSIMKDMVDKRHIDATLFDAAFQVMVDHKNADGEWVNSYVSGFMDVDIQHKTLFQMVNALESKFNNNMPNEIIADYVGDIHAYCKEHFVVEEAMMYEDDYPLTAYHVELHNETLSNLCKLKTQIASGRITDTVQDVIDFCIHTLSTHLAWHDFYYFSFCKNMHFNIGRHFAGMDCVVLSMDNNPIGKAVIETVGKIDVVLAMKDTVPISVNVSDILQIISSSNDKEGQTFIAQAYAVSDKHIKMFNARIVETIMNRKHFRVLARINALIHYADDTHAATIGDISASGMMVESTDTFPHGTMMCVKFNLSKYLFNVPCEVVRSKIKADMPNEYGLKFLNAEFEHIDILYSFLFVRQSLDQHSR